MRDIAVFGATGSIGTQTLDLLKYSFQYRLKAVSFNSRYEVLESYLPYFDSLSYVSVSDEEKGKEFEERHKAYKVFKGDHAPLELFDHLSDDAVILNAFSGNKGLEVTLEAIRRNHILLLANKESLIIGSDLIKEALKTSSSVIYPIDSEHVALAKLLKELELRNIPRNNIKKLYVTASGGALRNTPLDQLDFVRPEDVLSHPTWNMGSKITVDSATMVNKGYEVIEASVLFDFPIEKIGACICESSLIHALIVFENEKGEEEVIYELSPADMKISIEYALSLGKTGMHRVNEDEKDKYKLKDMLKKIDLNRYPLFENTIRMNNMYGNFGMKFYNLLDTVAVNSFLNGYIPYKGIISLLTEAPSLYGRYKNEIDSDDSFALALSETECEKERHHGER